MTCTFLPSPLRFPLVTEDLSNRRNRSLRFRRLPLAPFLSLLFFFNTDDTGPRASFLKGNLPFSPPGVTFLPFPLLLAVFPSQPGVMLCRALRKAPPTNLILVYFLETKDPPVLYLRTLIRRWEIKSPPKCRSLLGPDNEIGFSFASVYPSVPFLGRPPGFNRRLCLQSRSLLGVYSPITPPICPLPNQKDPFSQSNSLLTWDPTEAQVH